MSRFSIVIVVQQYDPDCHILPTTKYMTDTKLELFVSNVKNGNVKKIRNI